MRIDFSSGYEQAGCRKPFKRLWISSMEEKAIEVDFGICEKAGNTMICISPQSAEVWQIGW